MSDNTNQTTIMDDVLTSDLNDILSQISETLSSLQGSHVFLTGGTGFIGTWLLEAFRYANQHLESPIKVTVLSRNPSAFAEKRPHLYQVEAFEFVQGDVCTLSGIRGEFSHLIHAATDASAELNEHKPKQMFDTVIQGTQQVLDFAVEKQVERVLFLSSGAVYGQQPWDMTHVTEDWQGRLDCLNPRNTYAEAKRAAEMLCAIYKKQFGLHVSIARIFALLGPYLPINSHFAAGNFISNAMEGKPIIVKGNGMPCRSYLYTSDLVVWLLRILMKGASGVAYNVGSDQTVSIKDLAERAAVVLGNGDFEILGQVDAGWNPGRYVPNVDKIMQELGVKQTVSLDEALIKTAQWNGWNKK